MSIQAPLGTDRLQRAKDVLGITTLEAATPVTNAGAQGVVTAGSYAAAKSAVDTATNIVHILGLGTFEATTETVTGASAGSPESADQHDGEFSLVFEVSAGVFKRFKLIKEKTFSTAASLLADTALTHDSVPEGQYIYARQYMHRYQVAASDATDHHVTTAGGLKLYVLPDSQGNYALEAFGAVEGSDIGPYINTAVTALPAEGGNIKLYVGDFLWNTPVVVSKDNVSITGTIGLGRRTKFTTTVDDGSKLLSFVGTGNTTRVDGGGINKVVFDPGSDKNFIAVHAKYASLMAFDDLEVRYATGHAIKFENVWDTNFNRPLIRRCGNAAAERPAILLDTTSEDAANYIRFNEGHFEANYWSDLEAKETVATSRDASHIYFHLTKFHGIAGEVLSSLANYPAIKFDGAQIHFSYCYFYYYNHYFIEMMRGLVIANGNRFTQSNSNPAIYLHDGCVNSVIGPNHYDLTLCTGPLQESEEDENFYNEPQLGLFKLNYNGVIFDDGGRLAFAKNIIRTGGAYYQPDGSSPSYAFRINDDDAEGISVLWAAAGGTDGASISPTNIFSISKDNGVKFNDLSILLKTTDRILDDGGRLSVAKNINRIGSTYYQDDGSKPSYAVRVGESDTEGISILRAAAGGANGGAVTPSVLASISSTGGLKLNSKNIYPMASAGPANSSSTGSQGEWFADASYFYVCVATNTWRRVALSTF